MVMGGIEKECKACGKFFRVWRKVKSIVVKYIADPITRMPPVALIVKIFRFTLEFQQVGYNNDLFDRQYEVYLTVCEILRRWCAKCQSSKDLIDIANELRDKVYFIFRRKKTRQFFEKFRTAIIFTQNERDPKFEHNRDFLLELTDGQKLANKFPELKIKLDKIKCVLQI